MSIGTKIRNNPNMIDNFSNQIKLLGYALGMQGFFGDCNTSRPTGMFDVKAKAKWDAWDKLRGIPIMEARIKFLELCDYYNIT